jgi:hypothetical protein
VKWWIGLLLLLFVTFLISSSAKRSAAQSVLQHATENDEFFDFLVSNDPLVFRESPRRADAADGLELPVSGKALDS